jgi:putative hydrolase of the HAD superfamily
MKIDCIIFDLGNVVIKLDFNRMFKHWSLASGKNVSELKSRFAFDETYYRFENGELTPDFYRAYASNMMGIQIPTAEFDRGFNSIYVGILPGIENVLQTIRTKTRIVALTNTNEIHASEWKVKFASMLSCFEKVFCSHELQVRKPESQVYAKVLDYLALAPEHVLFIDDNHDNVFGAEVVGINGLHVKSFADLIEGLKRRCMKTRKNY